MFININCASFHLWCKENLLKHQRASKYYENDCSCFVGCGLQGHLFCPLLFACIRPTKSETGTFRNFLQLWKQHRMTYLIVWMILHHSFYANTSFLSWKTSFVLWNLKEKTFFDTFLVRWFKSSRLKLFFIKIF